MNTVFLPKAQAFLGTIKNPALRAQMEPQVNTVLKDVYSNQLAKDQHEISGKYSVDSYNTFEANQKPGVAANPADWQKYKTGMYAMIDSLPDVDNVTKFGLKQKLDQSMPGIIEEALKVQDPEAYRFYGGTRSPSDTHSQLPSEGDRIAFLTQRLMPIVVGLESGGNPNPPDAGKGAVGLMQIIPDQAGMAVANKIGDKAYQSMTPQQRVAFLQNPDNNRKYGATYLGMMLDKYHGDAEAALIAYNAGPGNADKWLASGRNYGVLPDQKQTVPYVQQGLAQLGAARVIAGPANRDAPVSAPVAGNSGAPGKTLPVITGTQAGRQPLQMDGVKPQILSTWQQVQGDFGRQVPIVSGFRDAATNAKAGGANHSQHLDGNAIDLDVSNMSKQDRLKLVEIASARGFTGIGIYNNSIHLDMRQGERVVWGFDHHADSVPPWAFKFAANHKAAAYGAGTPVAGGDAAATGGSAQPAQAADPGPGNYGKVYVPDAVANMPISDFQQLQANVVDFHTVMTDAQKAQLAVDKANTASQAANDIASIEQTGKGAIQGPDTTAFEQQILAVNGTDGEAKLQAYREDKFVAQKVWNMTQDAGRLSDAQLEGRLMQLTPRGGPNAAVDQKVYEGVSTKIKAIQAARKDDPATASMQNFPEVAKAWAAVDPKDPDTARAAIQATVNAQIATGVPGDKVQPLPLEAATRVVSVIQDETQPVDARINALVSTVRQIR